MFEHVGPQTTHTKGLICRRWEASETGWQVKSGHSSKIVVHENWDVYMYVYIYVICYIYIWVFPTLGLSQIRPLSIEITMVTWLTPNYSEASIVTYARIQGMWAPTVQAWSSWAYRERSICLGKSSLAGPDHRSLVWKILGKLESRRKWQKLILKKQAKICWW